MFFFYRELKKFKQKEMMGREMTDTGVCEVISYCRLFIACC